MFFEGEVGGGGFMGLVGAINLVEKLHFMTACLSRTLYLSQAFAGGSVTSGKNVDVMSTLMGTFVRFCVYVCMFCLSARFSRCTAGAQLIKFDGRSVHRRLTCTAR